MKWAQSLIRIAEFEIEQLRKRVGEIVVRREVCEMIIASLHAEAEAETANARKHAEAGWYLVGFRQGWKLRLAKAEADLASVQLEEQGARDALTRAYEELKKVEHVAELAKQAEAKELAKREAAVLDELALRKAASR